MTDIKCTSHFNNKNVNWASLLGECKGGGGDSMLYPPPLPKYLETIHTTFSKMKQFANPIQASKIYCVSYERG